jgi:hypothetical protein
MLDGMETPNRQILQVDYLNVNTDNVSVIGATTKKTGPAKCFGCQLLGHYLHGCVYYEINPYTMQILKGLIGTTVAERDAFILANSLLPEHKKIPWVPLMVRERYPWLIETAELLKTHRYDRETDAELLVMVLNHKEDLRQCIVNLVGHIEDLAARGLPFARALPRPSPTEEGSVAPRDPSHLREGTQGTISRALSFEPQPSPARSETPIALTQRPRVVLPPELKALGEEELKALIAALQQRQQALKTIREDAQRQEDLNYRLLMAEKAKKEAMKKLQKIEEANEKMNKLKRQREEPVQKARRALQE